LLNPWAALPEQPPFVLAEDAAIVEAHNSRRNEEHQFRPNTLPEPFMGSPDAPVVLLNLNPGFDPSDITNYAPEPRSSMMRRSLTHALPAEDAFYFLTEEFEGTGGWTWWYKKLKPLIEEVGLDRVRSGIQVIEYIPYKSTRFHPVETLPSQEYTFQLARQAVERDAAIVVMRRANSWLTAVPALADHGAHKLNSAQNVIISPRNCLTGFDEIVEKLRQVA
jgi:hypothetical protein